MRDRRADSRLIVRVADSRKRSRCIQGVERPPWIRELLPSVAFPFRARAKPPMDHTAVKERLIRRLFDFPSFPLKYIFAAGSVHWTSDDLGGLGMAVAVDGISGNVYVAGFAVSEDDSGDTVFVYKVTVV